MSPELPLSRHGRSDQCPQCANSRHSAKVACGSFETRRPVEPAGENRCFQQVLATRLDGGVHPPQQGDAFGPTGARKGRERAFGGSDSGACVLFVSEAHPTDELCRRRVGAAYEVAA
jgi:hypothetical protein